MADRRLGARRRRGQASRIPRLGGQHRAYSAGSSGATYFTAATLCAALVMWITTNDGHGVLFIEGFVLGLLLRAALLALRVPSPPTATVPPRDTAPAVVCASVPSPAA
jgi:hypothetical protein